MLTRTALLTLVIALGARGEEADQVLITYEAAVGGRQISGVSHALQWSAAALTQESAQVRLRVPVESFDSGHPQFDALLRAAAQAERYPFIEIEGVASRAGFTGTLAMHGVSRPLHLEVAVTRAGERLVASASFTLELSDYGISAPGVASRLAIDFVARFPSDARAVISGGAVSSSN